MTPDLIGRRIVLKRVFNAPPPLVLDATILSNHVRNWWSSCGTGLAACNIDLQPGGAWRYVILGLDGEEIDYMG